MKSFRIIFTIVVLLGLSIAGTTTFAQEKEHKKKDDKEVKMEEMIQSKNFVFVPQTVMPLTGRVIHLNSYYTLAVSGDTVMSDLPYYGRAYVAPLNPAEGGIKFTSTNVNYTSEQGKKGDWQIEIQPNGSNDVRQMYLSISSDGYASLRVESLNRQSILFNGYITAKHG